MKKTMRKIGLGGSIVALIVCLVLVTGSTFSLFTTKDENDITVNAAKVELTAKIDTTSLALYSKGVVQTGKFENGGTATFTNNDKSLLLDQVTPGDKAEFNIVVTNASTVDIQYRIKWTYTGELADALVTSVDGVALTSGTSEWAKWTPDEDDTKTLKLSVELPIDVKDDYQDKSATIDFYIEAVQANAVQGVNVTTADELYTSLEMNGVAVLANDITLDRTLVVNKDAELYLAGHTLTNENGDTVINNAKLTIYEGAPVVVYSLRRNAQNIASEAVIGSIVSGNGSAIVNNGTLIINGGSFIGTDAAAVSNTEEAEALLIETGSFATNEEYTDFAIEYAAAEKVTINGGVFTGALPEDNLTGDGFFLEKLDDGSIVVATVEATIGTVKYSSIQKAVDNAADGDVITFAKNITQADGVIVTDKKVTIDLNGKTFTVTEGASTNSRNFKINGASAVTIENGTLIADGDITSGAYGTVRTEDTAQVTLNNLVLYSYRGGGLNVKVCSGTTVTINNTEIYAQYSGGVEASGGNVVLNNTKIEQKGVYDNGWYSVALEINGGGTITVNSGEYFGSAIETDANAAMGNSVAFILSSGGTLTINGGTFTGVVAEVASTGSFCGLIYADRAAVVEINGGNFVSNGAILDMRNNEGTLPNPTATLKGGIYNADPRVSGLGNSNLITVAEGCEVLEADGKFTVASLCAKVGDVSYFSIDEAIANWTNGKTLTLLSDVTLSDVITINSTEHHILDLGTYTMTAAGGKNAIEIIARGTGDAERSTITIKADATNPGGINAGNKSVIYYDYSKGTATGNDRPIIKIEGGVFTGSTSSLGSGGIYNKGTAARMCATLNISGGTFNCSILGTGKSKLLISGGTFNYSVGSQGDSTCYRSISGGRFKSFGFMTADASNKFWVGTSQSNYVGVYVDDEGYLVVGGAVITEAGDRFVAHSTNYSGWSSYLQYSSAKDNGLYYTSVYEALADNNKATGVVTVYVDELDLTGNTYKGAINIEDTLVVTFAEGTTPTWTVASADGKTVDYTDSVVDGVVTRTYTLN